MPNKTASSRNAKLIWALSSVPLLIPFGSYAEDGVRATLDVVTRIESTSESGFSTPQNEGERAVAALSFGLRSENSFQNFGVTANTNLVFNSQADDKFDIEDPAFGLFYNRQSRQSAFNFAADYRERDVDTSNFTDEDTIEDVETGEGERKDITLRTGFELGREAPTSLSLQHLYSRTTFSGDVDGNSSDSRTNRLNATLSFQLSQVASIDLIGSWRETDRDDPDALDQTVSSLGIGTTYAISEVLTFTGRVTHDEAVSRNATTESSNSGLGYGIGFDLSRPNGSLTFDLSGTETINGLRQEIRIGRSMDLPRGALSYSIGASKLEGSDLEPSATLSYSHDVSRSSTFNVNLTQANRVNSEDEETIRTSLSLGYIQTINEISSIAANANFAQQNVLADMGVDSSALSASLTYRRAVGSEWDMIASYRYTSSRRDDRDDRNTRTLFLGLERQFDWRP